MRNSISDQTVTLNLIKNGCLTSIFFKSSAAEADMFSIYKKKTPKGDKRNVEIMAHFHAVVAEKKIPIQPFYTSENFEFGLFLL